MTERATRTTAPRLKALTVTEVGRDRETGYLTEERRLDLSARLSERDLKRIRARLAHARQSNDSLDYLIAKDEKALRSGRWKPSTSGEIIDALDRIRRIRPNVKESIQRERLIVAAFRLGWLFAEAEALHNWPVVGDGRSVQERRVRGGHARIAAMKAEAAALAVGVNKIRVSKPTLSIKAAVRSYLANNDAAWLTDTDTERARKVENALRRLRPKKSGFKKSGR